ncbi:MAG: bifunctional metallophosphatase/5'-nucleotidase [Candidatus Cloacimonetes bacterium]|nr:bifunctional metallophosphatase/5'-nucleotidase [Candidatus Cloacimonadota bacterium]
MKKISFLLILILVFSSSLCSEEIRLNILFTNDIHGGIDAVPATFINPEFPPPLGGGASAAAYIKYVRKQATEKDEPVLLLDAGDFFQGHPIGTMTNGEAVIKYMNMVKYDAMTIGNHEFDAGYERLKKTLSLAEFPIVCANIVLKESGEIIPEAVPYIIKDIQGVKLAIIGLCTEETPMMSFPAHIEGLEFLPVSETAEKYIKEVKDKGADLILVLAHLGIPYDVKSAYQRDIVEGHINDQDRYWPDNAIHLAYKVKGIDLLFCGHIHVGYKKPWEEPNNHTLLFQNYAYGSNIGHVIIKIDEETKTISGYEVPAYIDGDLLTLFTEEFIPDIDIKKKIDSMQAEAEKGMGDIVGEAVIHLSRGVGAQSLIGNLVMDAMLEETGADFSFLNLGGVRDDINQGPVTYRDIFDVLPFESQIVTIDISGALLKKIIEIRVSYGHHGLRVAGGEVVYNKTLPNFQRVTKLKIAGEDWEPDKIYKVVTTDYLMQGNAGLTILTEIPQSQITYRYTIIRDALANYFRKHKLVTSQIDNRWKQDDTSLPTETISDYNKKNTTSSK